MQMKRFVEPALVASFLATPLFAQEKTMLVLDASGSMWGQIEGTAKITIAQGTIDTLLSDLDTGRNLGLMAYGHRRKGDCADIEVLAETGPDTVGDIAAQVARISPKGKTPMAAAIAQAATSMRHVEDKATVILISDGIETCAPDVCAVASALAESGVDFTAHVIGFDIKDPEADAQLACIAAETGGQYLSATDADSLSTALGAVAAKVPETTPEPEVDIRIDAQKQANIGEVIPVSWSGYDAGTTGYELIVRDEQGRKINGTIISGAAPLDLEMPAGVGRYEIALQRVSGQGILATAPIDIVEIPVTLSLPDVIVAGSTIEVAWTGPGYRTDRIGIGFSGERSKKNVMLNNKPSPALLDIPTDAGDYVITYALSQDQKVLAEVPITVTMPQATLTAPAVGTAGDTIVVDFTGPENRNDFIGIVPVGDGGKSKGRHTFRLRNGGPAKLILPDEAGIYDIHYFLAGENVRIATTQITIEEDQ
ncbi:VWA domain-containing protein [Shimia sp. R9_1]|uniref:vWA domain-containing protein n=1 Tax=Shimia sp. R9_1 TaxID=2821111 RepID=UPI001ADBA493|nr:VWA domain-containing protein [Shimia sp. R9_1]MBO9409644.1 VWA domain-containing protein [Shimia sp. R9_1]